MTNGVVLHPWDIDSSSDRHRWGVGFLGLRGIEHGSPIYRQPEGDKLVNQIDSIVSWTLGSRNWIVCLCESPSYVRRLFDYIMSSYVFTTQERALSVDVDDLLEAVDIPDGEKRDIIEHADLLLVNYCDPNNTNLKWKRGAVANIFQRRKGRSLSTVVNLFVRSIPDKMDSEKALEMARGLVDIFGESVYELFTTNDSKRVVIRPDGGKENG